MEGSLAKKEKKVLKIVLYLLFFIFGGFCLICYLYSCLLSFCLYAH